MIDRLILKRMGRPKSNQSKLLDELFRLYEERITNHMKILPPTDDVWSFIRKKLKQSLNDSKLSEKGIYSAAIRWYINKNGGETMHPKETEFEMSVLSSSEVSMNSSNEASRNVIKCSIKLESKVWKTIEPVEMTYRRKDTVKGIRTYTVLQPGVWSNVLVDAIAKKKEIPCGWVFKKNKCFSDKVTIQAVCTTCSANLFGTINELPNDKEPTIVNIEIHGMNARRHKITENRNVKVVGRKADDIAAAGKQKF